MLRSIVLSSFLILNCNSVLALDINDADKFGDSFITAIQNGKSVNFIPNKFHLDTFLYNAFGEDYLKLNTDEKNQAKKSLANSLKILHSSPRLVDGYQQMNFLETNLQQLDGDYIYTFVSQISGEKPHESAIYLKEIDGQIWIVDFKSSYWLTEFTAQMYQKIKHQVSIPELMKIMESTYREEFNDY